MIGIYEKYGEVLEETPFNFLQLARTFFRASRGSAMALDKTVLLSAMTNRITAFGFWKLFYNCLLQSKKVIFKWKYFYPAFFF